jgi:hypothetical protein
LTWKRTWNNGTKFGTKLLPHKYHMHVTIYKRTTNQVKNTTKVISLQNESILHCKITQNEKKRKLPRLCCILCLNILHIWTCCNLQVTTPLELWKQVLEEPWACTWTMLTRIDECALLIKVTNLQNQNWKILVLKYSDALYMTHCACSFQQSTKCT